MRDEDTDRDEVEGAVHFGVVVVGVFVRDERVEHGHHLGGVCGLG